MWYWKRTTCRLSIILEKATSSYHLTTKVGCFLVLRNLSLVRIHFVCFALFCFLLHKNGLPSCRVKFNWQANKSRTRITPCSFRKAYRIIFASNNSKTFLVSRCSSDVMITKCDLATLPLRP